MSSIIQQMKARVLAGEILTKQDALILYEQPLEELTTAANQIREHFCSNAFDICTIVNAKSGRCSEDCKFCAQSAYYKTQVDEYSVLSDNELVEQAKYNDERGVMRYSLVTSGKKATTQELNSICHSIKEIKKQTKIDICVSLGLLNQEQFAQLENVGITRVHNNLETSRKNFTNVCTTHTYDEKIDAIKAAQAAGLTVCSGGIMGLGESIEDRIDMIIDIRDLGVRSIPINFINPIPGTPFANNPVLTNDDACRAVAICRFLVPDAFIRLAGGRGLLSDKGYRCFCSGANAAISGDMLTTSGTTIESDMKMIKELGYEVGHAK